MTTPHDKKYKVDGTYHILEQWLLAAEQDKVTQSSCERSLSMFRYKKNKLTDFDFKNRIPIGITS